MKINISDLRKVKGIGSKTIDRIIEQFDESEYISKYNPNLKLEENSINCGDCLDLMNGIEDEEVDLILADLPYESIQADWDKMIDLDKLWQQYERIIKPNGAIILTANMKFAAELINSNHGLFRYDMVWEKTQATGHLNANKMPMRAHENILVFYKTPPTYNPQKTNGHSPMHSAIKKIDVNNRSEVYGDVKSETHCKGGATERFPRSVLIFKSDKQTSYIHSTQKPVKLFEYLIKTFTNEGALVVDNASGSGTTGIACINTNRKYKCIEKDKEYYESSVKRVKECNNG